MEGGEGGRYGGIVCALGGRGGVGRGRRGADKTGAGSQRRQPAVEAKKV